MAWETMFGEKAEEVELIETPRLTLVPRDSFRRLELLYTFSFRVNSKDGVYGATVDAGSGVATAYDETKRADFGYNIAGRQAHGSRPWSGIDPIVIGSQIVVGLQTIVSRQVDITELPAVVTVGQFDSGVRQHIIPDTARLRGTIRTFSEPRVTPCSPWRILRFFALNSV
jgi:hypothetical protein